MIAICRLHIKHPVGTYILCDFGIFYLLHKVGHNDINYHIDKCKCHISRADTKYSDLYLLTNRYIVIVKRYKDDIEVIVDYPEIIDL